MAKPDDEVLEDIANGSAIDCTLWPGLLERMLSRLDRIIHDDFPKPIIVSVPSPVTSFSENQAGVSASQASSQEESSHTAHNKENAPPQAASTSTSTSRPYASTLSPRATARPMSGDGAHQEAISPDIFPELNSIRTTLITSFATSPPHTIQRLAELILRPRAHYRFVGPYLRAVDRAVSVSSGVDSFPSMNPGPSGLNGGGLPNGTGSVPVSGSSWNTFSDGDDSLGGALLTPVSWLRAEQPEEMLTETLPSRERMNGPTHADANPSEADHGMVDDERTESLREFGAVTQGELLRQEQEAGVVPPAQPLGRQPRSGVAEDEGAMEGEDHHPHASGPAEVGIEDMGPQEPGEPRGRFDVDVALGRKTPSREVGGTAASATDGAREVWSGEQRDRDDDVILTDADGKVDEDIEPNVSS